MNIRFTFPLFGLVLLAACSAETVSPSAQARDNLDPLAVTDVVAAQPGRVIAMTQNMYVGADVDLVLLALSTPDPNDDFPTLLSVIGMLANTAFPLRAEAMADEIARRRPHFVGLQEVSQIDIDLTGYGLPVVVHQDFLPTLQASLAARGLHYGLAAQVRDIEATPAQGISLVDYDAMLVDLDRVTVTASGGQTFTMNLGVIAPGVELKRGWVWADVTIDDLPFRFISTHPESDLGAAHFPELRAAQITELLDSLTTNMSTILVGDLNDVPGSPMYQALVDRGFTDVWPALRPGVNGYTCCHLADLSEPVPNLEKRIDYIWSHDIGHPSAGLQGRIDRWGEVPADRMVGPAYPIWPSDHVGLVAELLTRSVTLP